MATPVVPYTGIPNLPTKLPHRNWFIFLAVLSLPSYLYYDDRQKAEAIKQQYLDRVRFLAEQPLDAQAKVRTCTVYASRWPGEEDGKAAAWWKRYVKPYLVAAAVDYTLPPLPEYTSLSELLTHKYQTARAAQTPAVSERELEGGIMLIGRHTLKEYLAGLQKGLFGDRPDESWIDSLDRTIYEDPTKTSTSSSLPTLPSTGTSSQRPSSLFPPLGRPSSPTPPAPSSPSLPPLPAPADVPTLPPTILIPYHPELGFSSIPRSICSFFNTRADVKMGAEAALAFILQQPSRDFTGPEAGEEADTSFDKEDGEWRVPGNFDKTPKQVEERMKTYYDGLPSKLKTVWELRHGREPTEAEVRNPPFTLEEYLEGQVKRERRARADLVGYEILKKNEPVGWDDRFLGKWQVWEWDHKNYKGASVFA